MLVSSVTCGNCGADCPEKGRFCPHCGTALYLICSHCGQKNTQSLAHCSHCNAALQSKNPERWKKPVVDSGRPLERRQLTIMFTDLVDSTGLADSMDPEDFLALIEAHRTIAVAPIMHLGGVVARYLGDGMLVLFGYPEAHEDDPERAVRAGLEVARRTTEMNQRWVGEGKGRIAVRIGIHTGIVVVGDVLKADVQELMAVFGNTPSIASRLQGLAQPNSVVLSSATKALLPEAIRCESRGNVTLKGLRRPIEIFSALEVREGEGDRRPAGRVLPFVNREQELATIRQHWAAAKGSAGSCLTIQGEPGIGKSRLIRAVQERIVTQPSRWLITRTSPYATNTDFFAFSELFRRLLMPDVAGADRDVDYDSLRATLKRQDLEDANLTIGLARLIGIDIPEDATATPLQPERARELTLAAITSWLQHESQKQPLVLVIEDLHWADASTLEAIDRLKPTLPNHPLLLLSTTRSAARTSLTGARGDGPNTADETSVLPEVLKEAPESETAKASAASTVGNVILLERLRAELAADLLGHVLQGVDLPKESVTTLLERANGVPLYLEELPKPVLEAGGQTQNNPIALPTTLRDSLMAQLDRMGEAKAVAQTAAVLGHSFERPLLEHVWEGDAQVLQSGLDMLADASVIRLERDNYRFRHALLAEISYDSLLRDDRRRIHRRTAEILARHFMPLAETRPDILARHHSLAGNHGEAFSCWMRAGQAAARRSANVEALEHFKCADGAQNLIETRMDNKHADRSLALHMARAPVLIALFGWSAPEVEIAYRRALESTTNNDTIFSIQRGLCNVFQLRGDLRRAEDLTKRLHNIAKQAGDKDKLLETHRIVGLNSLLSADLVRAKESLLAAIRLYDSSRHAKLAFVHGTNPAVVAYSLYGWTEWFLGDLVESREASEKALAIAEASNHPFSIAYALCLGASLNQCRGDPVATLERSKRARDLSLEQGFAYWKAWSGLTEGWAMALLGSHRAGFDLVKHSLSAYRANGSAQMYGYGLYLLADVCLHAGYYEQSMSFAEDAIIEAKRCSIRFFLSEAYRLLGEAMLCSQAGGSRSIEKTLIRSLREAKRNDMPMLRLRSSVSLLRQTKTERVAGVVMADARSMLRRLDEFVHEPELVDLKNDLSQLNAL